MYSFEVDSLWFLVWTVSCVTCWLSLPISFLSCCVIFDPESIFSTLFSTRFCVPYVRSIIPTMWFGFASSRALQMSFISDQVSCQFPGQQTPTTCPRKSCKTRFHRQAQQKLTVVISHSWCFQTLCRASGMVRDFPQCQLEMDGKPLSEDSFPLHKGPSAVGCQFSGFWSHTGIKILGPSSQNPDPLGLWPLAQVYHPARDSLCVPVICRVFLSLMLFLIPYVYMVEGAEVRPWVWPEVWVFTCSFCFGFFRLLSLIFSITGFGSISLSNHLKIFFLFSLPFSPRHSVFFSPFFSSPFFCNTLRVPSDMGTRVERWARPSPFFLPLCVMVVILMQKTEKSSFTFRRERFSCITISPWSSSKTTERVSDSWWIHTRNRARHWGDNITWGSVVLFS